MCATNVFVYKMYMYHAKMEKLKHWKTKHYSPSSFQCYYMLTRGWAVNGYTFKSSALANFNMFINIQALRREYNVLKARIEHYFLWRIQAAFGIEKVNGLSSYNYGIIVMLTRARCQHKHDCFEPRLCDTDEPHLIISSLNNTMDDSKQYCTLGHPTIWFRECFKFFREIPKVLSTFSNS